MSETARLILNGEEYEFPVIEGSEQEKAIDVSLAIIGSPPVIPVPVAFIALASSTTSEKSVQGLSFAYIISISLLFSDNGQ